MRNQPLKQRAQMKSHLACFNWEEELSEACAHTDKTHLASLGDRVSSLPKRDFFLTIHRATAIERRNLAPCVRPFPHQVHHRILIHSANPFVFPKTRATPTAPKETHGFDPPTPRTQGGFNDGTFLSPLTSRFIRSPETSNKGDLVLADFALKSLNCSRQRRGNKLGAPFCRAMGSFASNTPTMRWG